jgi:hypothetical protein
MGMERIIITNLSIPYPWLIGYLQLHADVTRWLNISVCFGIELFSLSVFVGM